MKICRRSVVTGIGAVLAVGSGCSHAAGMKFQPLRRYGHFDLDSTEIFDASSSFVSGNHIGDYKLGACGWNFTKHFLGAIEPPQEPASISAWSLVNASSDETLLDCLDLLGEQPIGSLSHVYLLMKATESNPKPAQSNFAFVRERVSQRMWALHWGLNHSEEWVIGAVEVPHQHLPWTAGSKVFSSRKRNGRDKPGHLTQFMP